MNKFKTFIIFSIFLFTIISSSLAQGTLIGVVSDSISGFDLPGANVMLEGTSIGASTDINGEYRISNYLLWQIAYAELYFTPTLWPDFRREHLFEAILDYQCRERRFGQTSEQMSESINVNS